MPQFDILYFLDDGLIFTIILSISLFFWHFFFILDIVAHSKLRSKYKIFLVLIAGVGEMKGIIEARRKQESLSLML
jgi:hypothetical protein